ASIGATLANGGVCPTTGEWVFREETVKHCLSMMYSCGMYDYSGEFASFEPRAQRLEAGCGIDVGEVYDGCLRLQDAS
ncbi:MAG: glutaminase, partial [Pseudomonadota bacterium]